MVFFFFFNLLLLAAALGRLKLELSGPMRLNLQWQSVQIDLSILTLRKDEEWLSHSSSCHFAYFFEKKFGVFNPAFHCFLSLSYKSIVIWVQRWLMKIKVNSQPLSTLCIISVLQPANPLYFIFKNFIIVNFWLCWVFVLSRTHFLFPSSCSVAGCHLWGCTESDTTEVAWRRQQQRLQCTSLVAHQHVGSWLPKWYSS